MTSKGYTTTFTTPSDREINMTRVFDAPREREGSGLVLQGEGRTASQLCLD